MSAPAIAATAARSSRAGSAPGRRTLRGFDGVLAVIVWAGLIAIARALALHKERADFRIHIGNPPLVGTYVWHFDARFVWPIAVGVLVVLFGPALADRLPWRGLLLVVSLGTLAWVSALLVTDGVHAFARPLLSRYEYLHDIGRVGTPHFFLHNFTARLPQYVTHVKAHPPGTVLLFWALHYKLGLHGGGAPAAVVIAAGALAPAAALVTVRELAGETRARLAAPFAAVAPAAIWIGTSADALYAGVSAVGIALFALSTGRRDDARGDALAVAAGLVLGAGLMFSYGIAPLGVMVVAIALFRRRLRPLLMAGAGVLAVMLLAAAAGFSWIDGLSTTRELYHAGVAGRRPYLLFILVSVAAFALALGPATFVGLIRLRDRRMWLLCATGLVAVGAAAISGLSRGETERIWLPFTPWLLIATAALAPSLAARRGWLALQVTVAIVLTAAIRSPW